MVKKIFSLPCGRKFTLSKGGKRVSLCNHFNPIHDCIKCRGKNICNHDRRKRDCVECRGSNTCVHYKKRQDCAKCTTNKKHVCKTCKYVIINGNRRALGITECYDCETRGGGVNGKRVRLETTWYEKLKEWNYYPSIHDKVIKNGACIATNKRRVDFLFVAPTSFPCHVLYECDENSHNGYDVLCEMARLQQVHDQIIANTNKVLPLLVVRFNPNCKNDIEKDVRQSLDDIFKNRDFTLGDARGVNIHKLIGYSKTRLHLYKTTQITKKQLI